MDAESPVLKPTCMAPPELPAEEPEEASEAELLPTFELRAARLVEEAALPVWRPGRKILFVILLISLPLPGSPLEARR